MANGQKELSHMHENDTPRSEMSVNPMTTNFVGDPINYRGFAAEISLPPYEDPYESLIERLKPLQYKESVEFLYFEHMYSDWVDAYAFRRPSGESEEQEAKQDSYYKASNRLFDALIEHESRRQMVVDRGIESPERQVTILTSLAKEMNNLIESGKLILETEKSLSGLEERFKLIEELQCQWFNVVKQIMYQLRRAKADAFLERAAEDSLAVTDPTEDPRFWRAKGTRIKKI